MKGEYARLARGSYLYFFGVFLFSCKVAQILIPLRPLKSRHREKCFDLGTNRHREKSLLRTVQTFPLATLQRVFLARVPYIVLYILSLPSPCCQFSSPLIFRPFSAPSLLHAAPSPRRPSLCLCPLCLIRSFRPIRAIRVQKKIIRVQKKFRCASCANTPSKLSPALYKLHANPSVIPLKSRKTHIFSNFLSQSLAQFRKSPYFCTR